MMNHPAGGGGPSSYGGTAAAATVLSIGNQSIRQALYRKGGKCCYTHATCVPEPLRVRARMLLEEGLEVTLERIMPSFARRSAPKCANRTVENEMRS